jgi:preprotein translocase subunit SecD
VIYDVLKFGFAALALAFGLAAWLRPARRGSFVWAAASTLIAAGAAFYHVFWPVAVFGLMTIWALITALPLINNAWRTKVGFTVYVAMAAAFGLYPTYHDEIVCDTEGTDKVAPHDCPAELDKLPSELKAEEMQKAAQGNVGLRRWLLANIPFRMVRGLDLRGGLRLVYTVDVDEAIKDKRERYYDELRAKLTKAYGLSESEAPKPEDMAKLVDYLTLRKPRETNDTIVVEFKDPGDRDKYLTEELLSHFVRELNISTSADGKITTMRIRADVETHVRDTAVGQAQEIIHRRIDSLGVKEAAVSPSGEDIIVEIPGREEKAFQEIRDIISQTARLEFKMVDDDANFFEAFTKSSDLPQGVHFEIENAPVGPGKTKPNYYARMEALPGETQEKALDRFKEWAVKLPVDEDHEIGFEEVYDFDEKKEEFRAVGWRTFFLHAKAELTGAEVREASSQIDQQQTGMPQYHVQMVLSPGGADVFEKLTEANVQRRFAIILDGKVESAPVIREKIGGGTARITMGSGGPQQQLKEAKKLELVLRSGALPAPISPHSEQRIGASLGEDAIDKGVLAAAIGIGLVISMMLFWYRKAGIVASAAVLFNMFMQMAILAVFGASMTLPGIAGLALTVGMSVDSNVLINERIKDEIVHGKTARAAVALGYDRAFTAIFDGHVTTLIGALILYQYGTGPIKGFAVTLMVGMLCNLYTGVLVTRLFFDWWVRGRGNVKLGLGL